MKNWKFDLFNFKKELTLDQLEISSIIERHLNKFDSMSEKQLTESLKKSLDSYSYDTDVKRLLESFEEELESMPLLYELKNLYKLVEQRNYGMLYREPLNKILDIISKDDDSTRMEHILNELALYDWVPEIKLFMNKLTTDPVERKNMNSNGGKQSKIFTVVDEIDEGHVAFIGDRWFMLTEKEIKQCVLTDVVKDENKLKVLENLEKAMRLSNFEKETINFRIDENLSIGLSMNKKLYLNGEEADKESTLEDLFNSPIVPYLKKNYYHIIESVSKNLDKVIDLDVACKVTNLTRPMTETYAFNYKDKMYIYNVDKRTGSLLFEYDSANQLIQDVQREMGYDLTDFFENKLSKELRHFKKLEDREKQIEMKIKEVNESIDELKENEELLKESTELKTAFDNLLIYKHNLTKDLNQIRDQKAQERKKLQ
ncbi:MAG: hypothetical protein WDA02_07255 [Saccharofermentanales bacterium]